MRRWLRRPRLWGLKHYAGFVGFGRYLYCFWEMHMVCIDLRPDLVGPWRKGHPDELQVKEHDVEINTATRNQPLVGLFAWFSPSKLKYLTTSWLYHQLVKIQYVRLSTRFEICYTVIQRLPMMCARGVIRTPGWETLGVYVRCRVMSHMAVNCETSHAFIISLITNKDAEMNVE